MSVTLKEQETIILYNNGELEAEIYTYDPKLKRKIEQAAQRRPDLYRVITGGRTALCVVYSRRSG